MSGAASEPGLSVHDTKVFIILFERAFKIMKNGIHSKYVIALLVAEFNIQ